MELIKSLIRFPDLIQDIAENYQVHHLAEYVLAVANDFHRFYESQKIIQDDEELKSARLGLAKATYIIIKNCLDLMGISTPKKM